MSARLRVRVRLPSRRGLPRLLPRLPSTVGPSLDAGHRESSRVRDTCLRRLSHVKYITCFATRARKPRIYRSTRHTHTLAHIGKLCTRTCARISRTCARIRSYEARERTQGQTGELGDRRRMRGSPIAMMILGVRDASRRLGNLRGPGRHGDDSQKLESNVNCVQIFANKKIAERRADKLNFSRERKDYVIFSYY